MRIAAEGASVVVADIEADNVKATCKKILAAGGKAVACPADIRDPKQVEAIFAAARSSFGPAGVLINTAGVGAQRHVLDTSLETLAEMYDVNVKGTFLCKIGRASCRERV